TSRSTSTGRGSRTGGTARRRQDGHRSTPSTRSDPDLVGEVTALLGRRGRGAPDASADLPDPETLQVHTVLLASEDRDFSPEAINLAGRIASNSNARVRVMIIARIWGTSFGFPNPGLMPNKREWDEQRKKSELAVRALKGWGLEADGHVIGTRNAAKK